MRNPLRRTVRLALTRLEDRATPATFSVTTLADTGDGSLREAVLQANAAADPDTIVFDPAVRGGTVNLSTFVNLTSRFGAVTQPAGPAALLVYTPITIEGAGETLTRGGATAFRLFQVTADGSLTLQNLTLSNGLARGGAGVSRGGGAAGLGGAVYNQGSLVVLGCTLTGNQAVGGAGGEGGGAVDGGGGGGLGGPGSGASGGSPDGGSSGSGGGFGGGGGAVGGRGGFGGGGGGEVRVLGVGRGGNGGFGGGGGGGAFNPGTGGPGGFGGIGGTSGFGVGGGGAGLGGAIFNQGGTVILANSTLTANSARGGDSSANGQQGYAAGGGLFNLNGDMRLTNVTVAGNTVALGAGGLVYGVAGGALYNASVNVGDATRTQTAVVTVVNSILADTTDGRIDVFNLRADGTATINATGPNLSSTAVQNFSGATTPGTPFTVAAPNLGPLANDGGFTQTMRLNAGSPALDAGSNPAAAGAVTDQRGPGYARVSNETVDIGAVEVQPAPVSVAVAPAALPAGRVGTVYRQSITASGPAGPFTFAVTAGSLPAGLSLSPAGLLAGTPTAAGTGGFTVTATSPALGTGRQAYVLSVTPATGGVGAAPRPLAVSGPTNGTVAVFTPTPAGRFDPTPAATLTPFPGFVGSVRTAVADVDGDGVADLVCVTGPGAPLRLTVVSGRDNATVLATPFDPFGGDFLGGGYVAAGDFDADGRAEFVVSPDQGGGPRVTVFSLLNGVAVVRQNFFGIDDPAFRGGARTSIGDINGDGTPDLAVAAGFQGGPRTALFDGTTAFASAPVRLVGDFFGFPGADAVTLRNGEFLALGDVDGDGKADLILGGGPGGAPRVFVLSGAKLAAGDVAGAQAAPIGNFFVAGETGNFGGVRVAAADADADGKAEVIAASGEGRPSRVRVYPGNTFSGGGEPDSFQDLDPFATTLVGGVFVG